MIDNLQKLGLSEREAKVYTASLSLGQATVDMIAKEAGIIRTTAYTQIESLLDRGLLSSLTEGKKTYFIAESPDNLHRLVEQQKQQAESNVQLLGSMLPELDQLYNSTGKRPNIRYFSGKAGIVTMRNEVLKMKGKELLVATSLDDFEAVFSNEAERNAFSKERQRKKIETRMLFTADSTPIPGTYAPEAFQQVSKVEYPFEFDIYIFDDQVAIASLQSELWAVIIESKAVATSMKTLFEMSWQFAQLKK